jgi:hypothetical protein
LGTQDFPSVKAGHPPDGRIDLPELLFRKKELAAQRRMIFVTANDIVLGRC